MNEIKILHLYPDLLNLYGDKGNILALKNRLLWREIPVSVKEFKGNEELNLCDTDILFLGGGTDKDEQVVLNNLIKYKDIIKAYVEDGGVMVATCGGFKLLGKYCIKDGEKTEALGVLDIFSEEKQERLISDVVVDCEILNTQIVGFENHSSRISIGTLAPLGTVKHGFGNDGSGVEGAIYKNVIATNLHGPVLPKNPELCDFILEKALSRRNENGTELLKLDDTLELAAKDVIINRFKD